MGTARLQFRRGSCLGDDLFQLDQVQPGSLHLGERGGQRAADHALVGAHSQLDLEEFRKSMAGRTWLDRDAKNLLDEAPKAYKPIETVIADSADLVEPLTMLSQFINYKGL